MYVRNLSATLFIALEILVSKSSQGQLQLQGGGITIVEYPHLVYKIWMDFTKSQLTRIKGPFLYIFEMENDNAPTYLQIQLWQWGASIASNVYLLVLSKAKR